MDIQTLTTAVQSIGFPIVMCGVMVWYVKYLTESFQSQINDMNAKFVEAVTQNRADIEQNKMMLTQILEKLSTEPINKR